MTDEQPNDRPQVDEPIPEEAQLLLGEVETVEEQLQEETGPVYDPAEAKIEAEFLTNMAADAAGGMHPALVDMYPEEVREKVAERLAPVLVKYGGHMPPWLEKWKDELMLAIVLGGVAYGSVKAVKEYQPPEKEAAPNES